MYFVLSRLSFYDEEAMTRKRGYQLHLSRGDFVLKDVHGRTQKFRKILSVLQDFHPGTTSLNCLDIGSSSGIITSQLGSHFRFAIGIDIDREAVRYAKSHFSSPGVQFLIGDSMVLPFPDKSIDVIICNHVYEHVPASGQLMDEVYRVLKTNGYCYFSAGNRYTVIEGHYGLPFLSWLPKPLAHLYLRMTGKGPFYYEEHLSLSRLKNLVHRFQVFDYTLPIIRNPEKFFANDLLDPKSFFSKWFRFLAPYVYALIPTYIWVLVKK